MLIQMKLLTDTVFGNGNSIPGGEDIAVLCDDNGFPYYRGSTFKGIFREELLRLLAWKGVDSSESEQIADMLIIPCFFFSVIAYASSFLGRPVIEKYLIYPENEDGKAE